MASGRYIAYYRVSTVKQGLSGLGLEAQKDAVNTYLNGRHGTMVKEFTEIESGKRNDLPELTKALALCRIHKATLLIAKLDRLARNVAFISNLMESAVEFTAVDFPEANRLTIHVLAAVAEYEASAISARTKAALGAARARGVRLGGYRGGAIASQAKKGAKASATVRSARSGQRAADLIPVIDSIRTEGMVSLRQIASALNERNIPTAMGGSWSPTQVQRVLNTATI